MTEKEQMERIVAEIPAALKRRAAAKAALEGKSLRDALIEILERWLNEEPGPIAA